MKKEGRIANIIFNLFFILISITVLYPVLLVIGISVSSEVSILENGYRVIPKTFSFESYRFIISGGDSILNAYGITLFTSIVGTALSVLIVSFYAYPLSRKDFKHKTFFTFFIFFTMLFSGGMVPWYIVCTNVLKLQNTIWALILPYLMNCWHVIIMRTFFQTTIPDALIEAAKLDGAGEYKIFFRIVWPLSLPGLATVGLFTILIYWNDWWLPLMLVTKTNLSTLQFLLQKMIINIQLLADNAKYMSGATTDLAKLPLEGARMALCVIAIGPIILAYPFFQKYFIKGLTIGSVKG